MSVLGTVRNGLRLTATNALVKGHKAPIVIGKIIGLCSKAQNVIKNCEPLSTISGCRTMLSKSRRGEYERPKPYPHETKDFNVRTSNLILRTLTVTFSSSCHVSCHP